MNLLSNVEKYFEFKYHLEIIGICIGIVAMIIVGILYLIALISSKHK